jgi:hypothetical protein
MFGGHGDLEYLEDTWMWDGTQWTQPTITGSSPCKRRSTRMVFDGASQKALLFGGVAGDDCLPIPAGSTLNDTWLWDWDQVNHNGSWTQWGPTGCTHPSGREGAGMAFAPNIGSLGTVVLFGGSTIATDPPERAVPSGVNGETWYWDGTGNGGVGTWTQQTPIASPCARNTPAMAYDPDRARIVLFGGESTLTFCTTQVLGDTWMWNNLANTWDLCTGCNPGPPARSGHRMAWDDASGTIVLFGGFKNPDGTGLLNDTWQIDGGPWRQCKPPSGCANPPTPKRCCVGLAYDSVRSRLVLFGGGTSLPGGGADELGDTWLWNATTQDWCKVPGPSCP